MKRHGQCKNKNKKTKNNQTRWNNKNDQKLKITTMTLNIYYLTGGCGCSWCGFSRANISTHIKCCDRWTSLLHCTNSLKWDDCPNQMATQIICYSVTITIIIIMIKEAVHTMGNTFGTRFIWYWYWTSRTLTTTNSPNAANTNIMQPAIHKSSAYRIVIGRCQHWHHLFEYRYCIQYVYIY